jgi:hypothetical protein
VVIEKKFTYVLWSCIWFWYTPWPPQNRFWSWIKMRLILYYFKTIIQTSHFDWMEPFCAFKCWHLHISYDLLPLLYHCLVAVVACFILIFVENQHKSQDCKLNTIFKLLFWNFIWDMFLSAKIVLRAMWSMYAHFTSDVSFQCHAEINWTSSFDFTLQWVKSQYPDLSPSLKSQPQRWILAGLTSLWYQLNHYCQILAPVCFDTLLDF